MTTRVGRLSAWIMLMILWQESRFSEKPAFSADEGFRRPSLVQFVFVGQPRRRHVRDRIQPPWLGDLFQAHGAEFQLGLLGDASNGADREVVGGIARGVEI